MTDAEAIAQVSRWRFALAGVKLVGHDHIAKKAGTATGAAGDLLMKAAFGTHSEAAFAEEVNKTIALEAEFVEVAGKLASDVRPTQRRDRC